MISGHDVFRCAGYHYFKGGVDKGRQSHRVRDHFVTFDSAATSARRNFPRASSERAARAVVDAEGDSDRCASAPNS